MAQQRAAKIWRIEGYDGATKILEKTIPVGQTSDAEIGVLMQRLASRHLTAAEVVCASLRRNAEGYAPLLELGITSAPGQHVICSGQNPHYMASIVTLERP